MLINLSIENVAVIEKADIDFSEGYNILTGETGAGKSILIDSLSMVLGMRTSRDLIRKDAPFAAVSALFDAPCDLSEFDITPEEDGTLLLYRKLSPDGKNICKINSRTVPLSVLRAVGELLVTIHGQNENISLLKPSYQLSLLDEYAKNEELLSSYKDAYKALNEATERLNSMKTSESEREMQKDTLSFRIAEIEKVMPRAGEDDELIEKRDALRNYSSIMEALESVHQSLSASGSAKDSLYIAMRECQSAADMDKNLTPFSEKLTDLYYTAEDLASEISSYISRMSFSPHELDEIEERLDSITRIKKKYGPSIEACLKNYESWSEELNSLTNYEDNLAALEKEVSLLEEKMLSAGQKLHESRMCAGEKLSSTVEEELSFLNMPRVRFGVSFTEHAPSASGLSGVEFLISTNPSEDLKPLTRIASGGEMSRIMLALKSALADCDKIGTLLFDEIDSGVSGKAAAAIARKLKLLAVSRQIICVTHLPQMAAPAHNHLVVSKDTSAESFITNVTTLDTQGRIEELARLISGDEITPAARLAAEEMLNNA